MKLNGTSLIYQVEQNAKVGGLLDLTHRKFFSLSFVVNARLVDDGKPDKYG